MGSGSPYPTISPEENNFYKQNDSAHPFKKQAPGDDESQIKPTGDQTISMNKKNKIKGVIAAVVTPLDEKGHPHFINLQKIIKTLIIEGVNGILLLGTTGEGPSMSLSEQSEIISAGLEVSERISVLSCSVSPSLADAKTSTRKAFDAGVDGIVALPPYYYKNLKTDGLLKYFIQLLDEAVPDNAQLYLYHIPQLTGVPITKELLSGLLDYSPGQIGGVKDSQGNIEHTIELCQQFPQLDIFVGTDKHLLQGIQNGAAGCVTAGSNVLAPLDVAVYRSFLQGDLITSAEIQQNLTAARVTLEKYPPFAPTLKSLLEYRFATQGWNVRPPLSALDHSSQQILLSDLKQLGVERYLPWLMG